MERVYVGNLPPDIRIIDIDDFFRPFGKLVYIDVNNRANPVYAYVQFDSPRNAFNAVKSRHGYDYEGYTLQLRLVENEVRKRRNATPPPPPPPMLGDFRSGSFKNDFGKNFSNSGLSSFQTSFSSPWSNNSSLQQKNGNNRVNMPQNNMMDYQSNNRNNMQQQNIVPYSSGGRSNMPQQYLNRSNMSQQQQFTNSNVLEMPQEQYNNSNRSNMSQQQFSNSNRADMFQQNMNYSNINRSNMQQQNMNNNNYGNNNSWSSGNNMGGNSNNIGIGNNYNNAALTSIYNADNDIYARPGFEDSFTSGLSGSGRKWFNRYIRKGYSPEMARAKALEHRTVPYLREDPKIKNQIPEDPSNAALETIGNTIISLLATNPVDNFNNNPSFSNWGGDNYQGGYNNGVGGNLEYRGRRRQAVENSRSNMVSQSPGRRGPPRNRVSKQQYLKSLDTLKKLKGIRVQNAQDRVSKKYHTQIIKDYEQFEKIASSKPRAATSKTTASNPRNDKQIASNAAEGRTFMELSVALRKKKQQLFLAARRLGNDTSHFGGAFRKRVKILKNECGFSDIEARALAVHPLDKLRKLISMKADLDKASKKQPDPLLSNMKPVNKNDQKIRSYRSDVNYVKMHENQKIENLSSRVKNALRNCVTRVHKHEKEAKMPLTKTKFTTLLTNTTGQKTSTQKKQDEKKITTINPKKIAVDNEAKTATDTKKEVEKKVDQESNTINNKVSTSSTKQKVVNPGTAVLNKTNKDENTDVIVVEDDEEEEAVSENEELKNGEDNENDDEDCNEEHQEGANEEEYEDDENPDDEDNVEE